MKKARTWEGLPVYSNSEFREALKREVKAFYVYVLLSNDVPFYVGKGGTKGHNPLRALAHEKEALHKSMKPKSTKSKFIRNLLKSGKSVGYVLAFACNSEESAFFYEQVLISDYKLIKDGGTLLNLATGGQGSSGFKMSRSSCLSMSITRTGKKQTPEHNAAISEGRKRSALVKADNLARRVPVKANGIWYDCAKEAALALGVCIHTIRNRINNVNFPNYSR